MEKKMRILGINGSPRGNGATEYALKHALAHIEQMSADFETDYWSVRGKKISPCVHCDACIRQRTMCIIEDDHREVEQKILAADALIIASPVYDMNISAQLAAVLNRIRPVYLVHSGHLAHKIGAAITTGGTRYGGMETAKLPIIHFYMMHEMLVTGGLGGCYIGGSIWSKDKKAQGASDDAEGMATVLRTAEAVAQATIVSTYGREALRSYNFQTDHDPLQDH